jgi:hypothetical protein
VYSNFSIKNWKKMKSPSFMRNGRFHPPHCRGKDQKMGVLYTHSPKMLGVSPNTKNKKIQKVGKKGGDKGQIHSLSDCGLWLAIGGLVGGRLPALCGCPTPQNFPSLSYPPFFAHVVNSCSLAPAHACPIQTSPKIFKHP